MKKLGLGSVMGFSRIDRFKLASAGLGLIALALAATPAWANDPDTDSNANVMSRARPEYDAIGIHAGSFFIYPLVEGGATSTDNVYNDASEISDFIYTAGAKLRIESDWNRHAFNIVGEVNQLWYADQPGEDRMDWRVGGDARIDIIRGEEIVLEAHYADEHEARGTDFTGGLLPGDAEEPTELTRLGGSASIRHSFDAIQVSFGGTVEEVDYQDTPRILPAVPDTFNNDDRDRLVSSEFVKAAYEAATGTAVFVRGTLDQHNFDLDVDDYGFNHDSKGWTVDGGLDLMVSHMVQGTLSAGYMHRSYDDPAFTDIEGLAFGAAMKWFVTMMTTVNIDGGRDLQETSIPGASSYVSSRASLGIDHELLRNLILSASVGYENRDYGDIVRQDDTLRAKFAGTLLLNNYLHLKADWQYIDNDSDALGYEYKRNDFSISLAGKL